MQSQPNPMYPVTTIESAAPASREAMKALEGALGFVPNVAAVMAQSPQTLSAFLGLFTQFHHGTFSGAERQTLLLGNAVTNRSAWAVAIHSWLAKKEGVSLEDVEALRADKLPSDRRLAALRRYSRELLLKRGLVDARSVEEFVEAGFTRAQTLEVVVGLAISAITNGVAGIANPPLEERLTEEAWAR